MQPPNPVVGPGKVREALKRFRDQQQAYHDLDDATLLGAIQKKWPGQYDDLSLDGPVQIADPGITTSTTTSTTPTTTNIPPSYGSGVRTQIQGPFQGAQEAEFKRWYQARAQSLGLDPNPDSPHNQYDYRSAFQSGAGPDQEGHWPSQFKTATHPNRFVGGLDTITGQPMTPRQVDQMPHAAPRPTTDWWTAIAEQGSGFKKGLVGDARFGEYVPFLAGGYEFADALELYQAAQRMDQGNPTERDGEVLRKYAEEASEERNWGYTVGSILKQLPAFVGEFALTGGIYTAGRKLGVKGALALINRSAQKALTGAAKKRAVQISARQAAQRGLREAGVKGVTARSAAGLAAPAAARAPGALKAARLAGAATGVLAQTPVAGVGRIAAGTVQRMTPGFGLDPEGELVFSDQEGDDFLPAMIKAFGDHFIEIGSERTGFLAAKLLRRLPLAEQMRGFKQAVANRWLRQNPDSTMRDLLGKVRDAAGWHGVLGEMFEERVGELARVPMEGLPQHYNSPGEFFKQLAAEAVAFAIPGAGAMIGEQALARLTPEERAQVETDANEGASTFEVGQRPREGMLRLVRRTRIPGITTMDPEAEEQRTKVGGAEHRRRMNEGAGFPTRMYFQAGGSVPEDVVKGLPYVYRADVPEKNVYDLRKDPDGLASPDATEMERQIKAAGYAGYRVGDVVAMYDPVEVEQAEKVEGTEATAFEMVSPSVEEEMLFPEAMKRLDSDQQASFKAQVTDILTEMELPGDVRDSLGDWVDGTENSLFVTLRAPVEWPALRRAAARKGIAGNQKMVIPFRVEEGGEHTMYFLQTGERDIAKVKRFYEETVENELVSRYGARDQWSEEITEFADELKYKTMIPTPEGVQVAVFDSSGTKTVGERSTGAAEFIEKIGEYYGSDIETYRGTGEFLGSFTSRAEGLRAFRGIESESAAPARTGAQEEEPVRGPDERPVGPTRVHPLVAETFESLREGFRGLPAGATFQDLFRERLPETTAALVESGVVTPANQSDYLDPGTGLLNAEGQDYAGRLMTGAALDDLGLAMRLPAAVVNNLGSALPDINDLRDVDSDNFHIIREALKEISQSKGDLDAYLAERRVTGPPLLPMVEIAARMMGEGSEETSRLARISNDIKGNVTPEMAFRKAAEEHRFPVVEEDDEGGAFPRQYIREYAQTIEYLRSREQPEAPEMEEQIRAAMQAISTEISTEEMDAMIAAWKAHADGLGIPFDRWFQSRIAGIYGGADAGELFQANPDLLWQTAVKKFPPSVRSKMKRKALAYKDQRQWYEKSHEMIMRKFTGETTLLDGTVIEDSELMFNILAITSIDSSPSENLRYAMEVFRRIKRDGPTADLRGATRYFMIAEIIYEILDGSTMGKWDLSYMEDVVRPMPSGVKRGRTPRKGETFIEWIEDQNIRAKITSFYWNLKEPEVHKYVTVDRWMARLFLGRSKPKVGEYKAIADVIRSIAKSLDWPPGQVQAAIWASALQEESNRIIREAKRTGDNKGIANATRAIRSQDSFAELYESSEGYAEIVDSAYDRAEFVDDVLGQVGLAPTQADRQGAVRFLADGRALVHLFESANVSTLVHESWHIYRRELTNLAGEHQQAAEDLRAVEEWLGVSDGVWLREHEETFARAGEGLLRDGKVPDWVPENIRPVLARFRKWLMNIYQQVEGGPLDIEMNDEVRAAMWRVWTGNYAPEVEAAPPGPSIRIEQEGESWVVIPSGPNDIAQAKESLGDAWKDLGPSKVRNRSHALAKKYGAERVWEFERFPQGLLQYAEETPELLQESMDRIRSRHQATPDVEVLEQRVGRGKTLRARAGGNLEGLVGLIVGTHRYDMAITGIQEVLRNGLRALQQRRAGPKTLRLDWTGKTLKVVDTGVGMSSSVATEQFVDIGGSTEGQTARGFGVAKVALFAAARSIKVITVDATTGKVTVLQGSGAEWSSKGLKGRTFPKHKSEGKEPLEAITGWDFTEEADFERLPEVIEDLGIGRGGTAIEVSFGFPTRTEFEIRQYMRDIVDSSRGIPLPGGAAGNIRLSIAGEEVRGDPSRYGTLRHHGNITTGLPGALARVFVSEEWSYPSEGGGRISIFNQGVPVSFQDHKRGAPLPNLTVVDIHPVVDPGTGNYPFGLDGRPTEKANEEIGKYLSRTIFEESNFRDGDDLRAAIMAAPQFENGTGVVDENEVIPRHIRQLMVESPYLQGVNQAIGRAFTRVQNRLSRLHDDYPRDVGQFGNGRYGGIGLGRTYLGVNIWSKYLWREGDGPDITLINPYNILRHGLFGEDITPAAMARQIYATLVHELTHQVQRSEDDVFGGMMTKSFGITAEISERTLQELTDALEREYPEDINGTFSGHFTRFGNEIITRWERIERQILAARAIGSFSAVESERAPAEGGAEGGPGSGLRHETTVRAGREAEASLLGEDEPGTEVARGRPAPLSELSEADRRDWTSVARHLRTRHPDYLEWRDAMLDFGDSAGFPDWTGLGAVPDTVVPANSIAPYLPELWDQAGEADVLFQEAPKGEAFKRWFGDSKVVDESGQPVVMYHGTVGDFEAFSEEAMRPGDYDAPFNGFWFTNEPESASPAMRDPRSIMPVYLSIKNPATMGDVREAMREPGSPRGDELRRALRDKGFDGVQWEAPLRVDKEEFERTGRAEVKGRVRGQPWELRREEIAGPRGPVTSVDLYETGEHGIGHITGYESVDDFLSQHQESVWVAFSPAQIKSATGNRGTYDPEDPRILFQEATHPSGKTFKDWFKGSVVVTDQKTKRPKKVYHATRRKDSALLTGEVTYRGRVPLWYFSDKPRKAFGPNVVEAYLSIKNPFELHDDQIEEVLGHVSERDRLRLATEETLEEEMGDPYEALKEGLSGSMNYQIWQDPVIVRAIKEAGFDGVIAPDSFGGEMEYAVFSPDQVRVLHNVLFQEEDQPVSEPEEIPGEATVPVFVVGGQTKPLHQELEDLGGQHSDQMAGWVFKRNKRPQVERFLAQHPEANLDIQENAVAPAFFGELPEKESVNRKRRVEGSVKRLKQRSQAALRKAYSVNEKMRPYRDEEYWKEGVQEKRQKYRRLHAQRTKLLEEAAALRNRANVMEATGAPLKGDATRERQAKRDRNDQVLKVGSRVRDPVYGLGQISAIPNPANYRIKFEAGGGQRTRDKSVVSPVDEVLAPVEPMETDPVVSALRDRGKDAEAQGDKKKAMRYRQVAEALRRGEQVSPTWIRGLDMTVPVGTRLYWRSDTVGAPSALVEVTAQPDPEAMLTSVLRRMIGSETDETFSTRFPEGEELLGVSDWQYLYLPGAITSRGTSTGAYLGGIPGQENAPPPTPPPPAKRGGAPPPPSGKTPPGSELEEAEAIFLAEDRETEFYERQVRWLPVWVQKGLRNLQRDFVSRYTPLRIIEKELHRRVHDPLPAVSIDEKYELLQGAAGKAEADIIEFRQQVVDPIREHAEDFNTYLFYKRTEDRLSRDPEKLKVGTWTMEKTLAGLGQLREKVGNDVFDKLETQGEIYNQFMRDILHEQVVAGRMTQEVYDRIVNASSFYAPFQWMKWYAEESNYTGVNKPSAQSMVKRIVGIGDEELKMRNILEESVMYIYRSRILAERNRADAELGSVARYDTEYRWMKHVRPDSVYEATVDEAESLLQLMAQQKAANTPQLIEQSMVKVGKMIKLAEEMGLKVSQRELRAALGRAQLGGAEFGGSVHLRAFNSEVIAHELGHAVDVTLKDEEGQPLTRRRMVFGRPAQVVQRISSDINKRRVFQQELKDLVDYNFLQGSEKYKRSARERFAEFINLYLHMPEKARQLAPTWTEHFEQKFLPNQYVRQVVEQLGSFIQEVDKLPNIFSPIRDLNDNSYIEIALSKALKKKKLLVQVKGEKPPPGFQLIHYFEEGKLRALAVDKEVYNSVRGLGSVTTNVIVRFINTFNSLLRAGATMYNLQFQIRNLLLADLPRAALVSKYGLGRKGFRDYALGFVIDWGKSVWISMRGNGVIPGGPSNEYLEFLRSGAAYSTIGRLLQRPGFREDVLELPSYAAAGPKERKRLEKSVIDILGPVEGRSLGRKAVGLPKAALEWVGRLSNAVEETSKILGFTRAIDIEQLERLRTINPALAAEKAQEIAVEIRRYSGSPDFFRKGLQTPHNLNLLFMFFNARVQGVAADLTRLSKTFDPRASLQERKESALVWMKMGIWAGLPALYTMALNYGDDDHKRDYLNRSSREREDYFLIPMDTFYRDDNNVRQRDYWRVPKREIMKLFANLTEAVVKSAYERDPTQGALYLAHFLEEVSPVNIQGRGLHERTESVISSMTPLLKVPIEVGTNRNTYFHTSIVSDKLKRTSAHLQYRPQTTSPALIAAAENLSKVGMEVSPLVMKHIIQGFTARLFSQFLPPGKQHPGRHPFAKYPIVNMLVASPYVAYEDEVNVASEFLRMRADELIQLEWEAESRFADMISMNPREFRRAIQGIERDDGDLARKIEGLREDYESGITFVDRLIKQIPKKDGWKARFLVSMAETKQSKEEVRLYLQDKWDKGHIDSDVEKDLWEHLGYRVRLDKKRRR